MEQEFIQAQAAMTQQSLEVRQRALSQQWKSLRVQQSLISQLASSADADPLRKLREKDYFLPWLLEFQTSKEQHNLRPSNRPSWQWETPFEVFFLPGRTFQIGMSL